MLHIGYFACSLARSNFGTSHWFRALLISSDCATSWRAKNAFIERIHIAISANRQSVKPNSSFEITSMLSDSLRFKKDTNYSGKGCAVLLDTPDHVNDMLIFRSQYIVDNQCEPSVYDLHALCILKVSRIAAKRIR